MPNPDSADGETSSLKLEKIRDKMFGRLVERLCEDRVDYCDKLDFFEIRFDSAFKRLRQDAQEQVWREENRAQALTVDEETGTISGEQGIGAASIDPIASADSEDDDYRTRLDAAIDALSQEQIRIITMLRLGIPIDSTDPYAVTIAKTLGKSEKTIRTWRDKAFEAIRSHQAVGEGQ